MPAVIRSALPSSLPVAVRNLLDGLSLSPVSTAIGAGEAAVPVIANTRIGGQRLEDLLGRTFDTGPKRLGILRLSRPTDQGTLIFHSVEDGTPFEATVRDADALMRSGGLKPEGPPAASIPVMIDRLLKLLKK